MLLHAQGTKYPMPSDADLKKLVAKHIQTPVTKIIQPNGEVFLQRNFSAYLHALPQTPVQDGATDHGHDHNNAQLETFLNRPHPSVATLEKYFTSAASEFGVPVSLLRSYAQVQSNWAQVSESMYGSWGIMGLVEQGNITQISLAATLIGTTTDIIKNDAKQNIRAAAALLAHYKKKLGSTGNSYEDWFAAVAQLTGLTDADMRYSLAKRIYSTMQQGSKTISIWGEIILLSAIENVTTPTIENTGNLTQLGNGTPDYPGAIYNLTTCNYNSRPAGAGIKYYFVHYIATGTYEGAISWFKNCTSQVSAHYVVRNSDGQITQVVDEANRAWSQGVTEYNDQGIGVEHEVLATNLSMWDNPVMLAAAGRLTADVCNRQAIPKQRRVNNGDKGIYGHSDVRATECPNMTQPQWDAFMANVQGALPSVGTPTFFSVVATAGSGAVTATWKANTEATLAGYRLYYATDDNLSNWLLAADETTLTAGTTSITLQPTQFKVPPAQPVFHFKLTALVPNGSNPIVESGSSDVYSRSWMVTGPKVLIVDGFDRSSGSYKNSTHSFATNYLKALRDRSLVEITTVANEKIEDGSFNLSSYNIVCWFVGDESSANVVFSASEKTAISNYLQGGGKLFISGSEIAYNIGRSAATGYDLSFMNNYLKANYVSDGSINFTPAAGLAATAFDGLNIPFGVIYPEDFPDDISPVGGATVILNYAVANTRGGIAYTGLFGSGSNPGALVYISFPLETASDMSMSLFMEKMLAYFGVAPIPAAPIAMNDVAIAKSGKGKRINVIGNDNGNGASINASSLFISTPPNNGTTTAHTNGTVTYLPNQGYTGNDAFAYKVASTAGLYSSDATVNINIQPDAACAATPPEVDDNFPLRELRGSWVSTVSNIDWPSSRTLTTAQQKNELTRILDTLRNTGINTVFLQVRPEGDALYASSYEPWSYWLTNAQGTAPSPLWDPLQFAIDEAHARGMDLHAWINPFRAKQSTPTLASNHAAVLHPEWTFLSGSITMLNPGLADVRNYVTNIVADIASRYDVDGIHFDDYFYPYAGMTGQDNDTYTNNNPGNIATIEDWRRNNINTFIALVYDTLQQINVASNRNIVFGVSPFGIWKSGTPAGITGTSSYSQIYCDPIAWMQAGKVDYVAPQLYWKITGAQDYDKLSIWWNEQGQLYGRHIYPGLALYKMTDANNWAATEIQNQINLNRDLTREKVLGQAMFSTKQLMADSKGLKTAMQAGQYRYKAYAPAMDWKDTVCPNAPTNAMLDGDTLRWDAPTVATDGDVATKYVVYKYDSDSEAAMLANDGTKVIDITRSNKLFIGNAGFSRFVITALDKNNNESAGASSTLPDIVLCPNTGTSLPALVQGNTYAWEKWNNENWEALSNTSHFSGTNSNTLSITNLPVSFYDTQLRCVANGNIVGPVYTIKFGTSWTAAQNNKWDNGNNWSCGTAPTIDVDVFIPGNMVVFPSIDTPNASARSVLLRYGANINVLPGYSLKISKD